MPESLPTPQEVYDSIDWSIFDAQDVQLCTCRCGSVYESIAKVHMYKDKLHAMTKDPCPGCGKRHDCRSIESIGWESMTITK